MRLRRILATVAAILLVAAVPAPAIGSTSDPIWAWPVDPPHPIARPFLAPPTPYASGHRGLDIRAGPGTEVRAPASGVVHFAGFVVDRPVISIRHAGGVLSSFEPVEPFVATGDRVTRGQVIGMLLPGHCDGGCLHLGARVDGGYVNPLLFLGGLEHAVLYPLAGPRGPVSTRAGGRAGTTP
jgi:murein DD-endopeptidase MepM/ murein hydrolase activator NlpD